MSSYRRTTISFGPPLTRAVKDLILITSATFGVSYLAAQLLGWTFFFRWFSLQADAVTRQFFVWQLGTYLFLHADVFHILFNMFALWMFGSDLERQWGFRRFLYYYFLTGVGAGLCDVALNRILAPGFPSATIGCSGAIYGLLLAYGLLFPDRPIFLWMIIPIPAKWFALGLGAIEFLSSLSRGGSRVSHVAHLGGMLFGYAYLRGGGFSYRWQLRYHEWRRARLRKKFEVYMHKHEKKDSAGRWIN